MLATNAQYIGNEYSSELKDIGSKKEMRIRDVLCSSEHGVYLLRRDDGHEVIVLMNEEGEMKAEANLPSDLPDGKSERKISEAFIAGSNLFAVSAGMDRKEKRKYLIVDQFNAETLEFIRTVAQNVDDYSGLKGMYMYGVGAIRAADEMYEEDVAVSQNGKYWAIYSSSYTKQRDANEGINLGVYDQDGEMVWNMNEDLEFRSQDIDLGALEVAGNGEVYLRCNQYSRTSSSWSNKTMQIQRNGSEITSVSLPEETTGMTGVIWGVMDNGNWEIYGYTRSEGGRINGYKWMIYDPINERVISENSGTFSEDFIRQFISQKVEEKAEKKGEEVDLGISSFKARQIIKSDDGTMFMVGEQFEFIVRTYTDSKGGTHTTYTYKYGAIIVIKLDKAGNMLWSARIPRSQISSKPKFVGHYLNVCNGEVSVFFNDNVRNCETPNEFEAKRYLADTENSRIHVYHISADGEVEGYAMPESEDGFGKFRMGNAAAINGCGVFILEEYKKGYKARFIRPNK